MAFGGTVKLTGESEYKKALADITNNLKVLNSEMKVVTSQYDKNDKSTENLAQQNEVLNKKIAEQHEKVGILAKALADAEQETGENSETTKKWKIELNNAQAELNKLVKEVDDNEKAMKDSEKATEENTDAIDKFGKEADDSGKSALKLGDIIKANLISEGIIAGVKALGNAVKSVGSALVDIGKQAIDSYGEYEQLVGGVDTLFGEASQKVQEYANNAYKTAGLTANQYMETVTSFSASMISSLGGDTVKASEVANRAIIDMSDNANKMGTSMESIQNAYQGFAKQNYTMLDNLKLGYGGTKGEMQRLIQDASKMTAVQKELGVTIDANDMSFANIANAISVVQKNMGIAGATSKEASTTMTGSISAMKGAWGNLITGLADENANFEQLVNNLIDSIIGTNGEGGIIANFLPRIATAINGIGDLVVGLGDKLLPQVVGIVSDLLGNILENINTNIGIVISAGERIFETLLNGIMTHSGDLVNIVVKLVNWLAQAVLDGLPMLLQAGIDIVLALIQGITEVSYELIPCIIDCVVSLVETILDNIDLIIDAGIELIMALVDGLLYALPDLIDKIPVIIDKLIMALSNNIPKLIGAGIELTVQLAWGIIKAIPNLLRAIPQIITSLVNGFANYYAQLFEVGKNLLAPVFEWFGNLFAEIGNFFANIGIAIGDFFANMWTSVTDFFGGIFSSIGEFFTNMFTKIGEFLTLAWEGIQEFLNRPAYYIGLAIGTITRMIVDFFTVTIPNWWNNMVESVGNFFKRLGESITNFFTKTIPEAWNNLIAKITEWGKNLITSIIEFFTVKIPNAWNGLITKTKELIDNIVGKIRDFFTKTIPEAWKNFTGKVKSTVSSFGDFFKDLPNNLKNIGKNIVEGLWNGIKNGWNWLKDKVTGFANDLLSGFKEAFGIHSPSRLFKDQVGNNLALGIGEGFADTMADVSADMANAIPTEFDTSINANYGVGTGYSNGSNYDMMVSAFKQALTEVKVVMNNREMGAFVTNTIERVVYA